MVLKFAPNRRTALWGEENWLVSALAVQPSVPSPELSEMFPGTRADLAPTFPLLVKTIDARMRLSVQVHPNERTCLVTGGAPKAEIWFALRDSAVYAGLKPGVEPRDIERAVVDGSFEELLLRHDLKAGDAMFIPGGLVHSICENSFIYEVQQSSDTTFRLYDWGRVGADGRPRELHVAKALAAIDYTLAPPEVARDVECPYFRFSCRTVRGALSLGAERYTALYVFRGEVRLRDEWLVEGESRLILGEDGGVTLEGDGAEVLVTSTVAKGRAEH